MRSINIISRYSACRSKYTFEITTRTSAARKLLIAFGLGFGTVGTSDGCSTSCLRNHDTGYAVLVVLVLPMYSVVALEEIPGNVRKVITYRFDSYRRANDMWQVKHLNGLMLVSKLSVSAFNRIQVTVTYE